MPATAQLHASCMMQVQMQLSPRPTFECQLLVQGWALHCCRPRQAAAAHQTPSSTSPAVQGSQVAHLNVKGVIAHLQDKAPGTHY